MSNIEKRLNELSIDLPECPAPKAMYVPVVQSGDLCFVSGQLPSKDGILLKGKVGDSVSESDAVKGAELCIINALAALKSHLGDLDRITRIVKLQAFVSSAAGFDRQHIVANGASELLFNVFGEKGRHARTAVGVNQLPLDASVEIEMIVEVK